jgi:uncharacterized membrane protein YhaH (DUF805 family)
MTFGESIKGCFSRYAIFDGRASRSEYWWWTLFALLASVGMSAASDRLSAVFSVAIFLPSIAVAARRLHDIDRSGWWQLVALIPVVGWIVMLYWLLQPPKEPNRFGGTDSSEDSQKHTLVP